jgi:hypothetical protein
MHRRIAKLVPAALLALCGLVGSCSKEQGPARDARAEAAASAAQRLQGRWLLQNVEPARPLEWALQQLLYAQVGQLMMDVNGLNMSIRGPGVTVQRTYRIDEAYGEHLQMMVFDSYGVGFRVVGDFSGNMLLLSGIDAPWVGRAAMARVP